MENNDVTAIIYSTFWKSIYCEKKIEIERISFSLFLRFVG